jgi:TonB family protein
LQTNWLGTLLLLGSLIAAAQQPATPPAQQPAPIERHDPALEAATDLIGRALILRCFCAGDNLAFDEAGHPQQAVKLTDWTLAGVDIKKATRRDASTIELDGVRVAVRYAPDRHEFDRHPQNDEKMKILLPSLSAEGRDSAAAMRQTAEAVFSEGIDLRLQRAMPPYWLHYFLPATPWPKDGLEGQTIVSPGLPGAPAGLGDAKPLQRSEPSYTSDASHDHVSGVVLLKLVVDTQGQPQRTAIVQPLGYGLDARAVAAVEKYRFAPATTPEGKPYAANVLVRQEFQYAPGQ